MSTYVQWLWASAAITAAGILLVLGALVIRSLWMWLVGFVSIMAASICLLAYALAAYPADIMPKWIPIPVAGILCGLSGMRRAPRMLRSTLTPTPVEPKPARGVTSRLEDEPEALQPRR